MKLFTLSLSLLIGLTVTNAQNKLVAGSKLLILQESKITSSTNMMGTDIESVINSTVYITVEVKSVSDTGIIVNSTNTRIKGSVSGMGQDVSYDTNDSTTVSNPMVASQLKNINKPQTFILSNGKVKAINKSASAEDESLAKMMDAGSESLIEELFIPTETKNKNEGYKWTTNQNGGDGTQQESTIFILTKATQEQTEVTSNTNLSNKGTIKMMGMDVKQNITGTRASTMTYQKNSGVLTAATQNIAMTGTEELMGNNIPISMKGVITISVL